MKLKNLITQNAGLGLGVCFLLASLSACEKEDEVLSDSVAPQAEEVTDAEAVADDIFEDADQISLEAVAYAENGRIASSDSIISSSCVSRLVERSDYEYSRTVTLTFEEGCEGPKGRVRTGVITVNRKIDFEALTYTVTTTFQDFHINGRKIEGTRTLVFKKEEDGVRSITAKLEAGKVTLEDGNIITRSGEFTKTVNRKTGEISLEGTAEGITRKGIAYTATITEPLVYKSACREEGIFMAVKGSKSITREDKADFTISYGEGDCDKAVTVSSEGESRIIEINITKK